MRGGCHECETRVSQNSEAALNKFRHSSEQIPRRHGMIFEAARNEKQYVTDVAQVLRTIIT